MGYILFDLRDVQEKCGQERAISGVEDEVEA